MPRSKEECPDCCTHTITITPSNCNYIWEEQTRIKKLKRKHVSVEFIINKVLSEKAILQDHGL